MLTLLTMLLGACSPQAQMPPPSIELHCAEKSSLKWSQHAEGVQHWCELGGRMHGEFVRFHLDGSPAIKGAYRDNKPEGQWWWYGTDGTVLIKGLYRGGKMAQRWTWNHPNGRTKQSGEFTDGRQNGMWTAWHDNGVEAESGIYMSGAKDGIWAYKDRQGEPRMERWHRGHLLASE